jgi:hypothetical protein
MDINTILNQIDLGAMALPEFQRGYLWNRNQVRDLNSCSGETRSFCATVAPQNPRFQQNMSLVRRFVFHKIKLESKK